MAKISADEIKKLARLSRISLSEEEITKFQKEIESILGYVDQLAEVDIEGVATTSQVTGLTNVTRADEVSDYGVSREDLLKNVPDQEKGYIKVKRVL